MSNREKSVKREQELGGTEPSRELLEIIDGLSAELHSGPGRAAEARLDSSLERDLGFDSMAKVELLSRIERAFAARLPEQALASAETPRDLLRYLTATRSSLGAEQELPAREVPVMAESGATSPSAERATTLVEVLELRAATQAERIHLIFYADDDQRLELDYGSLLRGARRVAANLQALGLAAGQTVAIMLPSGLDYFYCFCGIMLAGGIPVPLYPPTRPSQIEEHLKRHRTILNNCLAPIMITIPQVKPLARLLSGGPTKLRRVLTMDDLAAKEAPFMPPPVKAADIAFLQYTSGSTGNPKGVVLTHANLLANIRAMGSVVGVSGDDVFVSWLPLYHDMGLIGAWLGTLYFGGRLVLMSPFAFLLRPERWLWAVHRHGGTLSASPNFGYEFCLRKIDERDIEGLDLSSWRAAFNGAEPVSPRTVTTFPERFKKYGFRPQAMTPVYGLAESSVGLAFPDMSRGPLVDCVERAAFMDTGRAVPTRPDDVSALRFVACGEALPGHRVRIVDEAGRDVGDNQQGRLLFRGPSATSGYFRNPEATARLFCDADWLDTGDLAYMRDGEIFITGRIKDIIIKGGRNIYPHELEEAVGVVEGVRKGCVAVFGAAEPGADTERLVVVAETTHADSKSLERMRVAIIGVGTDLLGMPPDRVLLARPHTVLKTSSGKIRRSAVKQLYEQGGLGRKNRAVWLQLTRVLAGGLGPALRGLFGRAWEMLYAGYSLGLFGVLGVPVWLLTALLPSGRARCIIVRLAARLLAKLSLTPIMVSGLENIPDRPAVFVANHASYLDGFVLTAALPLRVSFVGKAELKKSFLTRIFLSAMDVEFVERFDFEAGMSDLERIVARGRQGQSLFFFPEGTFHRLPGLLPFHLGAFIAAAKTGMDVVPVTIRGTREKLPSGSWFPRKNVVSVIVDEPIAGRADDWTAAVVLRDAARARILTRLGEPDLAGVRAPARGTITEKEEQ